MAIEYERVWLDRLIKDETTSAERASAKLKSRQMSTIMRNIMIVLPQLIVSGPIFIVLVYLSPGVTALLVLVFAICMIPYLFIGRTSTNSYNRMMALQKKNQRAVKEGELPISRETQDNYEMMLKTMLISNIISSIMVAAAFVLLLILLVSGAINIAMGVVFLIGGRFLMSRFGNIATGLNTINRFYSTLADVSASSAGNQKPQHLFDQAGKAHGLGGSATEQSVAAGKPGNILKSNGEKNMGWKKFLPLPGEADKSKNLAKHNEVLSDRIVKLKETIDKQKNMITKKDTALKKLNARLDNFQVDQDFDIHHHNSVGGMDSFFSSIESQEIYFQFGRKVRSLLDEHDIDLNNKRLLGFGVGPGLALKDVVEGSEPDCIVGYDFSENALHIAREAIPTGTFGIADIYTHVGDSFDIVLCMEVLEHLEYPAKAAATLASVVAPGGTLIITVPEGRIDRSKYHVNFWSPISWEIFIQESFSEFDIKCGVFKGDEQSILRNNYAILTGPITA